MSLEVGRGPDLASDPEFQRLVTARSRFSLLLTALILALYFGFILFIAFAPHVLGQPLLAGGVTTVGIPLGVGVIVGAFVLTGIYVARANTEFDRLTTQLVERYK